MKVNGYTCATCGDFHAGLPLAYGAAVPLLWESIPENEREVRGVLSSDLCWLSTSLPCYPDTLNLKAQVQTRPLGMRPYVELEPTDHPLAMEQRTGISIERVREIAECVLHS